MAVDANDRHSFNQVSRRLREGDESLTEVSFSEGDRDLTDTNLVELASLLMDNEIVTCFSLQSIPLTVAEPAIISSLLSMPRLTTIRLVSVSLSVAGIRKLTDSKSWSNLVGLNLGGNSNLGPRGVKSLAEKLSLATELHRLDLRDCRVGCYGAKALGMAKCLPSSLVDLDLGHNAIGNDGIWKLTEAMSTLVNLKSLSLSNNQIADEGAGEIGRQLEFLNKLAILDLSDNEIANVGVTTMCSSIPNCNVVKLNLSGNRLGDDGAVSIGRVLGHASSLEELDLGGNEIQDRGAVALAEGLTVLGEDSERTTSFISLSLKDNRVGDEGAGAFVEYLDEDKALIGLDLTGNSISSARLRILNMLMKHRKKPSNGRTVLTTKATALIQGAAESHVVEEAVLSEARRVLEGVMFREAEPAEIPAAFLDLITNNFHAQSIVSHGAFGSLFLARDSALDGTFAIRKVHVGGASGTEVDARKRVLQELVALRDSHHEHIAKLKAYAVINNATTYLMVYDNSNQTPLDECIADKNSMAQTLWPSRLNIALNIGSALEFLHNTRLCFHGDVRSANIFVTDSKEAKLIDGGVSRLVTSDHERFRSGDVVYGSRGYRCPRYERGSCTYGLECDIFSFGIVLAELFTGRLQNDQHDSTRTLATDFYYDFIINKSRDIGRELDSLAGAWNTNALSTLCKMILACLDGEPMCRPGGSTLVKLLGEISNV